MGADAVVGVLYIYVRACAPARVGGGLVALSIASGGIGVLAHLDSRRKRDGAELAGDNWKRSRWWKWFGKKMGGDDDGFFFLATAAAAFASMNLPTCPLSMPLPFNT